MAFNQEFIDAYKKLLILQYRQEPKAEADIDAKAKHFSKIYDLAQRYITEFDVDVATNHRLDILGKIIVFPRIIDDVVPKQYFGFDDNITSTGFQDKFSPSALPLFPFLDKFEKKRGDTELNDFDYRFFIKAKIAKNTGSATISDSDNRIGLQNSVINFGSGVYISDNQNMTLTMYVSYSIDLIRLNIIRKLDLVPRPQAVRLNFVQYEPGQAFGFVDNTNSKTFGDKFLTNDAGFFASKVI